MRRLLAILAGALSLWLAGAQGAPAAAPADPSQQVLVMLRLPSEHFRSGANYADGYGGGAGRAARARIAGRIAKAHGLALDSGWPMPLLGVDCFVMSVPAGRSPAQVVADLEHDRDVAWSQAMQTYRAESAATPNDPLYRAQPATRAWRMSELHQLATGRNVKVAVVDSAVDAAHPDLAGQIAVRQDFVTGRPAAAERHGTAVAGVIAARLDNQAGIVGVAPGAQIMALRACWQEAGAAGTVCDTLSLAKALQYAVEHRAQVINMSLAGPPDILLGRLLDIALARGSVVVGAADRQLARGGFPASHLGVVAVASEPGLEGTYFAPGRDIPTTEPGGRWGLVNGSSYSAAHVSGLFALMREREPGNARLSLVRAAGSGAVEACASVLAAGRSAGGGACAPPALSANP